MYINFQTWNHRLREIFLEREGQRGERDDVEKRSFEIDRKRKREIERREIERVVLCYVRLG
jgi:hypothetical protein